MRPNQKTLDFEVDPEQGAAAMLSSISLPGHRVVSVDRYGTKATVTYEELQPNNQSNHDQSSSL